MLSPTGRDRDELLRAAVTAPSMHNTQPWKFRFSGRVIEVYRDLERALPAEDPDGRMLHLSLGAAIFNLRVGAAHLAYGADVRCVLDRSRPNLVAEVELVAGGAETEQLYQLAPYLQWLDDEARLQWLHLATNDPVREDDGSALPGAQGHLVAGLPASGPPTCRFGTLDPASSRGRR